MVGDAPIRTPASTGCGRARRTGDAITQSRPRRPGEHSAGGRGALALFDLNGTLTTGNIWAAMQPWIRHNRSPLRSAWFIGAHVPLVAARSLRLVGPEAFVRAWARDIPSLLGGLTRADLDQMVRDAWRSSFRPGLRAAIVARLRQHQQDGFTTIAVSATYQPFLEPLRTELGIDHVIGTQFEMGAGALTGRIVGEPVTGPEKARRLQELIANGIGDADLDRSFAYADSEADLDLLRLVGNPVAVCPSRGLARVARREGWPVLREAD